MIAMADILTEIDDLFGRDQIPSDESGCLCSAIQLMRGLNTSLLMLTDARGRLIAVENVGFQGNAGAILDIATQIAEDLTHKRFCSIDCITDSRRDIGFGIRLTAETDGGILSGLLDNSETTSRELERLHPILITCGSVIWLGIHAARSNKEQARRVQHLLAEQDTLKRAHAHTVATVIEEREERIRQQRDYVIHLEKEVEKRSNDLRVAMNKANEANEAKSAFLANMSHEIRTPMTAILGYADVLFESGKIGEAPPLRVEAIETIRRNGKYLVELINDILDIAKVEAGKLVIERVTCSPSELMAEVITLMRMRAREKRLALAVEYDGPIPSVIQTDPIRLRQILVNLVGNAIKFTDAGGVKIAARCQRATCEKDPVMEFDIIDSGIGLSGPQIAKLFQPFSQVDASAARRYGGTGLGLALSRRLARELGGDVSVTSQPGKGSTFRVTIATGSLDDVQMLADPTQIAEAKEPVANAGAEAVKLKGRILLAEDSPDCQKLIEFFLRRAGAQVVLANNGQEAVDKAFSGSFDMILMDMQMPVLDGYDATRELRRRGYKKPIIALTAHTMSGDRQKCLDAGCDDFANKPIECSTLLPLVAGAIAKGTEVDERSPKADLGVSD